ncbi:MAG: radical SAM protein [Candidatus Aegiribacteria sp.]|nr:radical SAM protein [Candidatus Aegiribacteria sp.]
MIISPPVITPSEPPSGAFLLAAGLEARGISAGFLDLSLEFFSYIFSKVPEGRGYPAVKSALTYLRNNSNYNPGQHRTVSGVLNSALKSFSKGFPGWKISLMDLTPPSEVHKPEELLRICNQEVTPFSEFWEEYLLPILQEHLPKTVLLSLSYLSQLPAGIDLAEFLKSNGYRVITGGSLLNSLDRTGKGFDLLRRVLPETVLGDGSLLLGVETEDDSLLSRLSWPYMLNPWRYVSGRPVIPYALSTGCAWNKCLFCPDRKRKLSIFGKEVFEEFISTVPPSIMKQKPVIHLLDSTIPRKTLLDILPALKEKSLDFYGFIRPEKWISDQSDMLADHGCLMLQLGAESGSYSLLDRFNKGIDPETSLEVIRNCAGSGIRTYVYMLLGLPGETLEDLDASVSFLREAGNSIDFINFSIFNLPTNCELSDRADEFGIELVYDNSPEDVIRLYMPFLCEGQNPRIMARGFITEELSRLPSVSKAQLRTPKWFRTSHFPLIEIPGRISHGAGSELIPGNDQKG